MTENEEKRCITSDMFYCRVGAGVDGCGLLQTSSRDSDVLRNRQQKHTASHFRYFKLQKIYQLYNFYLYEKNYHMY